MNPEHRESPETSPAAAADPPPLTSAAMQAADAALGAYLEARGRDFRSHGWKDADGLIETRDGRALLAQHIDTTLRRAKAAETERDRAAAQNMLLRRALEKLLLNFYEKGHPGEPCLRSGWVPVRQIEQTRELLTALSAPQQQAAAQAPAGAPARPPLPPRWVNSSSTAQAPAVADPAPEHLPGQPGKLAQPPPWLDPALAPRPPSAGHIAAYKLDHCGSCRDAEFYGWSGRTAERAHTQHLETIDVGPLSGQPCRCARCTATPGSGVPDA